MQELLTKRKFINALVREHLAIEDGLKLRGKDTRREYLRLELLKTRDVGADVFRLVIRGNRLGTYWMLWDQPFPNTMDGVCRLHKAAIDIARLASMRASVKTGYPVQIGMPAFSCYPGLV